MDTSNFKEVFESPKVKTLTAQVAALELEVVRLRGQILLMIDSWWPFVHGSFPSDTARDMFRKASDSIQPPYDTTALNELIEKVEKMTIERCAGECKALDRKEKLHAIGYGPGYLTYTASDCEQIIHALPTGQIKLEELLWPNHNWCAGCSPDNCSGCRLTEGKENAQAAAG